MARRFNGSNNVSSSRAIFQQKKKYEVLAAPTRLIDSQEVFRDFWFVENMYYGKIDRLHNFVIANNSKLVTISDGSGNTITTFDFVAEALKRVQAEYSKAISTSKIQKDDQFLSELTYSKGHINILSEYDKHISDMANKINREAIRNSKEVENFHDFIDFFLNRVFLSKTRDPVTLTGFISSRMSSLNTTGLFVELSEVGYDNDFQKVNDFYDRPNYKFLISTCLKHGFLIDYNVPWRLCANIGSAEMERYMSIVGTSSQDLFETHYDSSYVNNISYLLDYLLKYYNRFIAIKPNIKRTKYYYNRGLEVYRYNDKRPRFSRELLDEEFDLSYRANLYAEIRNFETNYRYSKPNLESIKENADQKILNAESRGLLQSERENIVYGYVEHQFKGFFNDLGANNAVRIKRELEREGESSGHKLKSVLEASVRQGRNTVY